MRQTEKKEQNGRLKSISNNNYINVNGINTTLRRQTVRQDKKAIPTTCPQDIYHRFNKPKKGSK